MVGLNTPLLTIPGLGPVLAAGILAENDNISNFPSDNAVSQYAGLFWPENPSGDFKAKDTHLVPAGNTHLRYYLVEAAHCVWMQSAEYQSFCQKKF